MFFVWKCYAWSGWALDVCWEEEVVAQTVEQKELLEVEEKNKNGEDREGLK